ncbi:hypothetical protein V9T40_014497 [Parthenolecanium corni]|uniref:Uncharacterized protein n=1 Tax=Parthenolecanium corni TaxID=536013 RepID=A0AAN9XXJ8_9HEMI
MVLPDFYNTGNTAAAELAFFKLSGGENASKKKISISTTSIVVLTSSPRNEAELQLYRVMQRASLLSYYDTLLEMGGDDVQQLCDAGEEEFLEIMALVGMASKPLHVRRFQKALQEWLANPLMFQTPIASGGTSHFLPRPLSVHNVSSSPMSCSPALGTVTPASSPSSTALQQLGEISSCTPGTAVSPAHGSSSSMSPGPRPSSPLQSQNSQPVLDDRQIRKLEEAALRLVNSLPELEPKYHGTKKKVGKELQAVLNMSDEDPVRLQQIRKFSAIYGRFDCKRRPEKPLTLHEVSVNEAAAQICKYIPALLTRRDELFPLARQVVRDSGYHYSKGHSKSYAVSNLTRTTSLANTYKFNDNYAKRKYSEEFGAEGPARRQERLDQLQVELQKVTARLDQLSNEMQEISDETSEFSALKYQIEALNSQKHQLLDEQTFLVNMNHLPKKRGRKPNIQNLYYNFERQEADEIDSQYSYSNASSPYQSIYLSEDEDKSKLHGKSLKDFGESGYSDSFYMEDKFQVVAAKGDNIIAVTNPALLMSCASVPQIPTEHTLKKERLSPDDANAN